MDPDRLVITGLPGAAAIIKWDAHFMIGAGSHSNYRSPWRGSNHKVETGCSWSTRKHTLLWEGQICSRRGAIGEGCGAFPKGTCPGGAQGGGGKGSLVCLHTCIRMYINTVWKPRNRSRKRFQTHLGSLPRRSAVRIDITGFHFSCFSVMGRLS